MDIPVRLSSRAKHISIVVHWDGRCELVAPKRRPPSQSQIERFIYKHRDWIERQRAKMSQRETRIPLSHQGIPAETVRERTRLFIEDRIQIHSMLFPFQIESIKLRNYKAQWGSCSHKKSLGFHYKLSLLPKELADYIIVHELCHSIHFNHSKAFWQAVAFFCPEYKAHRKELKKYLI